MDSQNPIHQLIALEQRLNSAAPMPLRTTESDAWQAIAFELEGSTFLIDMRDVSEVSAQPAVTRLPGVQKWIKGIANVRGEVLTIVDLHEYFSLTGGRNPALNRVIAIQRGDTRLGVVVDRVIGMRQVLSQGLNDQISESCPAKLRDYISGSIEIDGERMDVFDPEKLVRNENFLNVSIL